MTRSIGQEGTGLVHEVNVVIKGTPENSLGLAAT